MFYPNPPILILILLLGPLPAQSAALALNCLHRTSWIHSVSQRPNWRVPPPTLTLLESSSIWNSLKCYRSIQQEKLGASAWAPSADKQESFLTSHPALTSATKWPSACGTGYLCPRGKDGNTAPGLALCCQPSSFLTQILCCNYGRHSSFASTAWHPSLRKPSVTLRGPSLGLSQTPVCWEYKPSGGISQREPHAHWHPASPSPAERSQRWPAKRDCLHVSCRNGWLQQPWLAWLDIQKEQSK